MSDKNSGLQTPKAMEEKRQALEREMQEEITLDGLAGDWKLYQRRRGHRYSTEDLLTAWYAMQEAVAAPTEMLDLGTGIGSVGLTVAWHFTCAKLTGIEAQAVSFRLLRENVWVNGVTDRTTLLHGDLRDVARTLPRKFQLVTGSPPYFDINKGVVAADSQKAHARFELRGDVSDYCKAAKVTLEDGGRFVFCFPTNQIERALKGVEESGLFVCKRRDVIPRVGIAPLFSLVSCAHEPQAPIIERPLTVRGENGRRTDEMNAVRIDLGMPTTDRPTD
jgi:tRNA1Val (adenine37-N6)-methyltransferase